MRLHPPIRLLGALDKVIEAHPYAASGTVARTARADRDSALLWERLTSLDPERLHATVRALEKRDERLLLYSVSGRLNDTASREVLRCVYGQRKPATHDAIAWWALLLSNGAADFREAAVRFASGPTARPMWRQWVSQARPLDSIASHYKWSKGAFDRWVKSHDVGLESRSDFQSLIKRTLLEAKHLCDTCTIEREQVVLEWTEEVFSFAEREAWMVSYLAETYRRRWSTQNAIVASIVKRYGTPEQDRPFWNAISADVKRAVETWLKDRELTARLGEGEHGERVAFWRQFLPFATNLFVSRCETAVFIRFDRWFAVQFVYTGRATYLFDNSHLMVMRRRESNGLYSTVLTTPSLDKYEHRGRFWSASAEAVVRRVMRRMSRS
jgi:hypothetical protein